MSHEITIDNEQLLHLSKHIHVRLESQICEDMRTIFVRIVKKIINFAQYVCTIQKYNKKVICVAANLTKCLVF